MKRLLATLTLALLVSLVLAAGATGAPGSGGGNMDSASGSVNSGFGQQETFSAKSSSIGTDAQGQWRVTATNTDPNAALTGDIRCLRVATVPGSGAVFEARGVVVDVRNAPFFTDQGFVLRGSDPGKFSNEQDTYFSFTTPEPQLEGSCLAPTVGFPVVDGEIVVKDAV